MAYAIESITGRAYIHGKLIGLCTVIVLLLQFFAIPTNATHRLLLSESSSHPHWEAKVEEVMLNGCQTAKSIAMFLKKCRLDCNFGPDNGNPSEEEVTPSIYTFSSWY